MLIYDYLACVLNKHILQTKLHLACQEGEDFFVSLPMQLQNWGTNHGQQRGAGGSSLPADDKPLKTDSWDWLF